MEITSEPLEFNSENVDVFRQFLKTQTGERLIPKIAESAPALLADGDVNKILIRSGEVRGFQLALQSMLALAAHQPAAEKPPENAYPNPEDDTAWNDGQKLNPEPK